jgi:hypothetical protein
MSLLVRKVIPSRLNKVHYDRELAIRVDRGNAPYETRIHPNSPGEPLSVRFTGAVARYQGRKGLASALTMFSETGQAEQAGAVDSEVRFEIKKHDDGYTICAMWLASSATRLGFTNDARFFKPCMRAVEAQLRVVDPALMVVKE